MNIFIPVIDEVSKDCGKGCFIDSRKNIIKYIDLKGETLYCKAKLTSRMTGKNKIEDILWKQGPEFKLVK